MAVKIKFTARVLVLRTSLVFWSLNCSLLHIYATTYVLHITTVTGENDNGTQTMSNLVLHAQILLVKKKHIFLTR